MKQLTFSMFPNIKLFGIPTFYDFNKVIIYEKLNAEMHGSIKLSIRRSIKWFILNAIFQTFSFDKEISDGKFLMFYGSWNYRKDHQKVFLDFANNFHDADCICSYRLNNRKFTPIKALKMFFLYLIWYLQLLINKYGIVASFIALPYIGEVFLQNKLFKDVDAKSYSFLVVYSDTSVDENAAVQLFKKIGITTMTMQHGIFSRKENQKNIADTGFELSESISDYYLAWNQYTYDEAIRLGKKPSDIAILGMPKYINFRPPENPVLGGNDCFGVILNSDVFEKHNIKLLQLAQQISIKYNYHYLVRYHPQLSKTKYRELFRENFVEIDDNNSTIYTYAGKVAFSLLSSSSVYVDLLFLGHPTFRLVVNDDDTYSTVKNNSFTNISEFQALYSGDYMKSNSAAFNYLCIATDIYQNYRKFFDHFLD